MDFIAICYRLEVDCDVISGQNVKTIEGYVAVNVEVASSNSFRDSKIIISRWQRQQTMTLALCGTVTLAFSI